MTKALSSISDRKEKAAVAAKRRNSKSGGLGYWGAMDALKREGEVKKETVKESAETLTKTE